MFQAESNAVAVWTGGGKGQPSCRRFFFATERNGSVCTGRENEEMPAAGSPPQFVEKRDRQVEQIQTPIALHVDSGCSGLGQWLHGTGTALTQSATV
jgi:hypothetical protein